MIYKPGNLKFWFKTYGRGSKKSLFNQESIWGPAPAVTPREARRLPQQAPLEQNHGDGSKAKNKKKKKMQKMDGSNLLSFTVEKDPNRKNAGEIASLDWMNDTIRRCMDDQQYVYVRKRRGEWECRNKIWRVDAEGGETDSWSVFMERSLCKARMPLVNELKFGTRWKVPQV